VDFTSYLQSLGVRGVEAEVPNRYGAVFAGRGNDGLAGAVDLCAGEVAVVCLDAFQRSLVKSQGVEEAEALVRGGGGETSGCGNNVEDVGLVTARVFEPVYAGQVVHLDRGRVSGFPSGVEEG